ncbi:MAG TPA: pseudouridine synthase [Vicinamibacterales bacterium]|nr:pseudouridine synthase [Vicinamibacterales bacterium]
MIARLQKILSAAGVASRRASEQMILEGRVTVNGDTVRELGTKADPQKDIIKVDGRRIKTVVRNRYIVLYKPKGYVTTRSDPEGRRTVIDLVGEGDYIYPVGRLDYDSEGLLLLTSDGDLAARLMHPRHEVEKTYEVIVAGMPDVRALEKLKKGVFIEGGRTAPAHVHVGSIVKGARPTTKLTIVIHEGRNRQIRRMCSAVGLPVRELRRVRMGPIGLGRLKPGQWRDLTPDEVRRLKHVAAG